MQLFIDLVNMTKWLMDENQQPSVTHELGRLLPSQGWRRGETSELLRVGAVGNHLLQHATDTDNTSFASRSITKRTTEKIWGSKATSSKKPWKSSHVA